MEREKTGVRAGQVCSKGLVRVDEAAEDCDCNTVYTADGEAVAVVEMMRRYLAGE